MTRRLFLFTIAIAAAAQVSPPRVGFLLDRRGALRPVYGVAGAFTLGQATEQNVVSAAYSGKQLVLKMATELVVDEQRFPAPEGRAVVTFDPKGQVREIFFPDRGVLWTWRDRSFDEALAAGPVGETAAVREGELIADGIPVRLPSKAVQVSQLGEDWLVVYAEDRTYAVRRGQAYELPEDSE